MKTNSEFDLGSWKYRKGSALTYIFTNLFIFFKTTFLNHIIMAKAVLHKEYCWFYQKIFSYHLTFNQEESI